MRLELVASMETNGLHDDAQAMKMHVKNEMVEVIKSLKELTKYF